MSGSGSASSPAATRNELSGGQQQRVALARALIADTGLILAGRVADVAYRGRGYEYAIDVSGLGRLTGVFARHRANRGDELGLRLDPPGCHLFAVSGSAAEAAADPALTT